MKVCARVVVAVVVAVAGWCPTVLAQAVPPSSSLTDLAAIAGFNALERASASANQATYNQLIGFCNDGVGPTCPDNDFVVFASTRELIDTANELLGSGSTQYSLGVDAEGLGFALRWTAAEEMAGQGSATTRFAASQLSALATRLSALRWGVSGLRRAALDRGEDDILLADAKRPHGGGASSDFIESHRWGSFIDGSFGYGSKDPTDLEDAFDFEGQEVTIGLDYRFSPALVVGVIAGYSDKEIDFDSSLSIVDGGIESAGYSGIVFGMLEGEHAYLTASIGYQFLGHDTQRRITYPSLNPTVSSANSLATSDADSTTLLATATAGYALRLGGFAFEPSLEVAYSDTKIDSFTEQSISFLPEASGNDPFNVRVAEQSLESFNVAPTLKFQYVFAPSFGAVIPYIIGRYHLELSDDARVISAQYADALESLFGVPETSFAVSTDVPDDEYYTAAGGFTVVFGNGLNGYLQYLQVFDFDNYDDAVITGGFRYEF